MHYFKEVLVGALVMIALVVIISFLPSVVATVLFDLLGFFALGIISMKAAIALLENKEDKNERE